MRYVNRDENGKINGSFARQQYPGQERLADDDPELVVFTNPPPPFDEETEGKPEFSDSFKQSLTSKEKYWRK